MIAGASRKRAIRLPWWDQRSPRERVLLVGMLAVAAGYLLFAGVARPLLAARADALASITRSDMALARLAALPEGAVPAAASDLPVTALVTETATEFGMAIRRIEPEADGARLTIDDADFGDVLRWIEALENRTACIWSRLKWTADPSPAWSAPI